jgi:hypothetical protein
MGTPNRQHARAKVTVDHSQAVPYHVTGGPALVEVHIRETFEGDIDATSTVRALQVRIGEGSARMVSMQRVEGAMGGRRGSFVLQGEERIEGGRIRATWSVVPDSGTGELAGLRGEGGFDGEFGKGSDGTLDYWFE